MPRRKRPRWVSFQPGVTFFKPRGVSVADLETVDLGLDELEALRLADGQGVNQVEAAKKMKISQSTFQRILTEARKKVAEALVGGKAIKVEGGEVMMPRFSRGGGPARGRGRGAGRGRMGGQFAAGPGGLCICTNPECKNEAPHQTGVPCFQMKCSKCGSPMIRKK